MDHKKNKEREGENDTVSRSSRYRTRDLFLTALIVIGVVAFGLLAVTQFLELRHKAVFLSTPCDLCRELNPALEECFASALMVYKDPSGEIITEEEYLEATSGGFTQEYELNLSTFFKENKIKNN